MFKYKSAASFVLMCGHMLVFIICIGCWFVYVTLVLLYDGSDSLPCQSADSSWYIWVLFFFVVLFDQSEELSDFTGYVFPSIIPPTTHFHQSCCQWNSVAPFLHPDGSQYFRLKLLLPWSQHLDCCHTRSRGSQQQLSFP